MKRSFLLSFFGGAVVVVVVAAVPARCRRPAAREERGSPPPPPPPPSHGGAMGRPRPAARSQRPAPGPPHLPRAPRLPGGAAPRRGRQAHALAGCRCAETGRAVPPPTDPRPPHTTHTHSRPRPPRGYLPPRPSPPLCPRPPAPRRRHRPRPPPGPPRPLSAAASAHPAAPGGGQPRRGPRPGRPVPCGSAILPKARSAPPPLPARPCRPPSLRTEPSRDSPPTDLPRHHGGGPRRGAGRPTASRLRRRRHLGGGRKWPGCPWRRRRRRGGAGPGRSEASSGRASPLPLPLASGSPEPRGAWPRPGPPRRRPSAPTAAAAGQREQVTSPAPPPHAAAPLASRPGETFRRVTAATPGRNLGRDVPEGGGQPIAPSVAGCSSLKYLKSRNYLPARPTLQLGSLPPRTDRVRNSRVTSPYEVALLSPVRASHSSCCRSPLATETLRKRWTGRLRHSRVSVSYKIGTDPGWHLL